LYANDNLAHKKSVAMSGPQAGGDRFVLYGYDNRHELTSAKWYNGTDTTVNTSPITSRQFTYGFDTIGNRLSDSGDPGVRNYFANSLNQYSSTGTPNETFSYDADGNLTADGTYYYDWDAE